MHTPKLTPTTPTPTYAPTHPTIQPTAQKKVQNPQPATVVSIPSYPIPARLMSQPCTRDRRDIRAHVSHHAAHAYKPHQRRKCTSTLQENEEKPVVAPAGAVDASEQEDAWIPATRQIEYERGS